MTLFVSDADVRASADVAALVEHLAGRLARTDSGESVTAPRSNVAAGRSFVRLGGAILTGSPGVIGYKVFHAGTGGGVRYLVVLAELDTGRLSAVVDGNHLTALRTGVVTAVATDLLACAAVERIAVLGSGEEAWSNLQAVSCVREAQSVSVYSPRPERRQAFAERVRRELGVRVSAAGSAPEAVNDAGVVIVATNTRHLQDPIAFSAAWARPGMHVNSIGSTTPLLRELDERLLLQADAVVFDSVEGSRDESGDVQAAMARGLELSTTFDLGDVLARGQPLRQSDADLTVFKSVGTASQDVAAAEWIVAECRRRGLGTPLELELSEKTMVL